MSEYTEFIQARNVKVTEAPPVTVDTTGLATETAQLDTGNTVFWLKSLLRLLKPLSIVTGSGSNRLSVDVNAITTGTIATVTTVTTTTTVGTVTSMTNQVNMGNVAGFTMQQTLLRNSFANGIRKNLTIS